LVLVFAKPEFISEILDSMSDKSTTISFLFSSADIFSSNTAILLSIAPIPLKAVAS